MLTNMKDQRLTITELEVWEILNAEILVFEKNPDIIEKPKIKFNEL